MLNTFTDVMWHAPLDYENDADWSIWGRRVFVCGHTVTYDVEGVDAMVLVSLLDDDATREFRVRSTGSEPQDAARDAAECVVAALVAAEESGFLEERARVA